ncbi:hypothetical protein ACJX0J_029215, partial [Zea mays]
IGIVHSLQDDGDACGRLGPPETKLWIGDPADIVLDDCRAGNHHLVFSSLVYIGLSCDKTSFGPPHTTNPMVLCFIEI